MPQYKLNPSAGRLYEKPYVKLHHTDVYYLSSLRALISIKIYKAIQSIMEDCSTHGRESVLCAFNVLFNHSMITQKLFK